jgi:hypothetical protein
MRIKQIITEAIKTADAEKLQQLRQSLQAQQQAKLQQDMDAWAQDFAANNRSRTVATDTQAQQNNPFAQQQSAPTRTRPANRMGSRKVMSRKQKITELIRKGSAFIKWADKYKDALPPNLQAQLENIENAWTDNLDQEHPDASPETESDYDTLLELYRKFYGDMLEYHNMKKATKKAKPSQIRRQQMKPSKAIVTKFNEEEIDTSVNETIRKIDAHHWRLYSGKGKNLGTFDSLGAAKKHEGEVQYFKHLNELDPGTNGDDDPYKDIDLPFYDTKRKAIWRKDLSKVKKQKFASFILNGITCYGIAQDGNKVQVFTIPNKEIAKELYTAYTIKNQRQ